MTTGNTTSTSPAFQKSVHTIANTKLSFGTYLKERDAEILARALDEAGLLKKRLR